MDCIFCKVVQRTAPAVIEHEDDHFVVFPDIRPKAPVHLLIVPKKHIISLAEVQAADTELMGDMLLVAQKVARARGVKGYKLQMNVGREGGQEVEHIHLHFLAQ